MPLWASRIIAMGLSSTLNYNKYIKLNSSIVEDQLIFTFLYFA